MSGSLAFQANAYDPELHKKIQPLSPQASLKTMELEDGYKMELAAAEPMIEEPVLFTYDGNGRLYVAEMLTYMQDVDGSGKFNKVSRIKRLEDKNNDGVFDSFTIFADNLLLPRMITTLEDGKILVRETNTLDLLLIEDTNDDGIADKKTTIYQGGPRGGNLEHQPSGLIYNLDNWMYVTYTDKRYKYVDGKVIAQEIAYGGGQWGLAHDDLGTQYYSGAGAQNPAYNFQFPAVYSQIEVSGEQAKGFREVFPLDTTPDVQGGLKMLRKDNTLNHFTGNGGQSIYYGELFDDMYGDYIIPEPVGNLVRRAKRVRKDGYTVLTHPYQTAKSEFIRSTDANFRPVWSDNAPDGSLMILDMYRGIIQEGNWTKKGSYLREVIDLYGFDKVIGGGRLYRVTKEGVKLGKQPKMYSETPAQLVKHLSHKNRWWRLEAQKLIVISGDKNVIPALKKMALDDTNPMGQIHALWTMEGLGVVDTEIIQKLFSAENTKVRISAIRLSEQLVTKGDKGIEQLWLEQAKSKNVEIAQQTVLSAYATSSSMQKPILKFATGNHGNKKGMQAIAQSMINLVALNEKRKKLAEGNKELAAAMIQGEKGFKSLCADCHGKDGTGTKAGEMLIAPSFVNNPRIVGNKTLLTNLVLHGLQGPIEGKTYLGGMMQSLASNGDTYVANVLTYIRNEFGNKASLITPDEVAKIKSLSSDRTAIWTLEELTQAFNTPLERKKEWKITTNFDVHPKNNIAKLTDSQLGKWPHFSAMNKRQPGQAITLELPAKAAITEVNLNSEGQLANYSRSYTIEFSLDGNKWQTVIKNKTATDNDRNQTLGQVAKFIKITNQIGGNKQWKINDLSLTGRYLD
ncbi:hypothetical protein XM47_11525 [Catenovulum maritimum]|uniref:Cytochrome c domain-containing protein n=2 Tax=Catenovulum maritimum TaxID=1513271 RepID=A0A0J8GQN9_9ALTE|nr:hypothetical protein XM47_11525 [Catenovulum maritimum]